MNDFNHLRSTIRAWSTQDPEAHYAKEADELLRGLENGHEAAIKSARERFGARLTFGTAGIRGPMRMGPNGINCLVIAQTTGGLAQHLRATRVRHSGVAAKVVIGFDGRHKSETFARETAEVLSGYGIKALMLPHMLPTPVLAFAVRKLDATAGIMITASHNPAADNGYKVYFGGADEGSQIISPTDIEIEAHIQAVADSMTWSDIPRSESLVSILDDHIVEDYLKATIGALNLPALGQSSPQVVYTSMHGIGGRTFLEAIEKAGFPEPHVVSEQFEPDPDFPTVSFPNPEEKGALDLSFEKARSVGADIVIAHDPDADRLAVSLPDENDPKGYRALTGNQVGAIFGWYFAAIAASSKLTGTLANSLVSSPVLGKIARHFGLDHEETLTGFKYVSRVKDLIFGFEEALGYLVTPEVARDKDGISAGLLMVSLAHTLADEGRTLWDYLGDIEIAVGAFASGQITARLDSGVRASELTSSLRERAIQSLGSRSVISYVDFIEGYEAFPSEDILRYHFDDGTRVIVRPSGTEPKVKFYIDTEGKTADEAQRTLVAVEADVNELLNSL